jgi:SAM-dependent methyltransferase
MDPPDPKRVVSQGYDAVGDAYVKWTAHSATDTRQRYTDILLQGLLAGAVVLDLGCGAGLPTTWALAQRFQVTGVDISPRQIERARRNVPNARFQQADMSTLNFAPGSFDGGVAAFYSIIHVPREEQEALLRKIAGWLRPGGLFVAAMGAGSTEAGYEPDWLGAPMYWSHFDGSTNRRLVEAAGLEIVSAQEELEDEDGTPVRFLWVVARKG